MGGWPGHFHRDDYHLADGYPDDYFDLLLADPIWFHLPDCCFGFSADPNVMVCSLFGPEPAGYFRCGYGIDFGGRLIARSHHYHDESADYIENIHHAHKRNACRGYPALSFAYNNPYRESTVCNNNHDLSMAGVC